MAYFPLCINLTGAQVFLLGEGTVIQEKREILRSFGANIRMFSEEPKYRAFSEADLESRPALVVVADMEQEEKKRISRLCQSTGIPVNVVDAPELCSFYFPSMMTRGNLTVSVSTGGKSPGAAAWLRRHLEQHIPDQTDTILEWAGTVRQRLQTEFPEADRKTVLRQAIDQALSGNRILEEQELLDIIGNCSISRGTHDSCQVPDPSAKEDAALDCKPLDTI